MRSTRINPILVAVIGTVLCLLAVGGITYFLILPTQQKLDGYQQRYTAAYPDSTPQAQASAKAQLAAAKQSVSVTLATWQNVENNLMPPYDVSNRFQAWQELSFELSLYLGLDLADFFGGIIRTKDSYENGLDSNSSSGRIGNDSRLTNYNPSDRTGVIPLQAVALPAPPASPNAITAAPLVVPIGGTSTTVGTGGGGSTIGVSGSFRQILDHVQHWNQFNRLVLVDSLSLHGNSPHMVGNYGASVIIFPQNDDKLGAAIPQASSDAAAGQGGAPGFAGGPTGAPGLAGGPGRAPNFAGGPGRAPGPPGRPGG